MMKFGYLWLHVLNVFMFFWNVSCSTSEPSVLKLENSWEMQSSAVVSSKGDEISTNYFLPEQWYPVVVPTTVLAALIENKVYPDPYYGENLKSIPGYRNGSRLAMDKNSPFYPSWWYRKKFEIPSGWNHNSLILHLDGINYRANVWLNGYQIADTTTITGMFKRFEIDITKRIKPGVANVLAIEVFAPGKIPDIKYLTKQIEATTGWDDHNPQPPDLNMGIWQNVFISANGPVLIRYPYVRTDLDLPSLDLAQLTVSANLINNSDKTVKGKFRGEVDDIHFEKEVTLLPQESKVVKFVPDEYKQLNIRNPRIWWPHKVGEQELYGMKLSFEMKGNIPAEEFVRFGIREVTTYIDNQGWRGYKVNGKNILIRGAAWMTSDMLLRFTPERYKALLRYAKDAGFNALRVEGFSIRENDEFYNLCDEYGILVIQQFFGRNLPDEKLAVSTIEDMLLRIRNHPSLIHFIGHDETLPTENLDNSYRELIARYTPERTYQPQSGAFDIDDRFKTGGTRTGTDELWTYVDPFHYYTHKDNGAWGFAQSGGIGGVIAPYESIRKMMPDCTLWPIENETFSFHTVIQGLEYFRSGIDAMEKRYGKPAGIKDFCKKGMAMNYESARAMFEAYARNKYDALGITTWKFNAAWPAAYTWQYVDWYLNVGGAYYGAKKACEPLHIQFSYDDNSIYVVNSFYKSFEKLKATAKLFDFNLNEKLSKTAEVNVGADGKTEAFKLYSTDDLSQIYFLKLNLEDNYGEKISDNFYWLSTVRDIKKVKSKVEQNVKTKSACDFKALERLPDVKLEKSFEIQENGSEYVAIVNVRNIGKNLAFMVHLALIRDKGGDEITPAYWDDNYFSLFPGEAKEIKVRVTKNDIKKTSVILKVDGWNVEL